jgi:hypothetical protein
MGYDVQNYEVYFGLYPSSGIYDKKSQRFGDWICLRDFCHIYQTMDKVQNKLHAFSSLLPGKNPQYPFHRRLGGHQSRYRRCGEDKYFLTLTEIELGQANP